VCVCECVCMSLRVGEVIACFVSACTCAHILHAYLSYLISNNKQILQEQKRSSARCVEKPTDQPTHTYFDASVDQLTRSPRAKIKHHGFKNTTTAQFTPNFLHVGWISSPLWVARQVVPKVAAMPFDPCISESAKSLTAIIIIDWAS